MAGNGLEVLTEQKAAQPPAETKSARPAGGAKPATEAAPTSRRRRNRQETGERPVVERFFLATPNANGDTPPLGREVASEGEAIVEAFKAGVNFFTVLEFRPHAEISSSRDPVLKKEAIKNATHSS